MHSEVLIGNLTCDLVHGMGTIRISWSSWQSRDRAGNLVIELAIS